MTNEQIASAARAAGKAAQARYGAANGRGVDPEYRVESELEAGEIAYYEMRLKLEEAETVRQWKEISRYENS